MSIYYKEDLWGWALAISIILMIFGVIWYSIAASRWDRECMDSGYRDAKVVWFLTPYCVQRVDQTDIVVSLERVRAGEHYKQK